MVMVTPSVSEPEQHAQTLNLEHPLQQQTSEDNNEKLMLEGANEE